MTLAAGRPASRLSYRLIRSYYWATPLFFLADFLLGVNIRVPSLLGGGGVRAGCYLAAAVCGGLLVKWPEWTPYVGLFESSANVMTIGSELFMTFLNGSLSGGRAPLSAVITPPQIGSFLLAGAVCAVSFYATATKLARGEAAPANRPR